MMATVEQYILCFNCGNVTPELQWKYMKWDDEGDNLIPVEEGDYDPIAVCPKCKWEHTDDDSNPGFMQGTQFEMMQERNKARAEWQDSWEETNNGHR